MALTNILFSSGSGSGEPNKPGPCGPWSVMYGTASSKYDGPSSIGTAYSRGDGVSLPPQQSGQQNRPFDNPNQKPKRGVSYEMSTTTIPEWRIKHNSGKPKPSDKD